MTLDLCRAGLHDISGPSGRTANGRQCRACANANHARYKLTDKGKAADRRWAASPEGMKNARDRQESYRSTAKGQLNVIRGIAALRA